MCLNSGGYNSQLISAVIRVYPFCGCMVALPMAIGDPMLTVDLDGLTVQTHFLSSYSQYPSDHL